MFAEVAWVGIGIKGGFVELELEDEDEDRDEGRG